MQRNPRAQGPNIILKRPKDKKFIWNQVNYFFFEKPLTKELFVERGLAVVQLCCPEFQNDPRHVYLFAHSLRIWNSKENRQWKNEETLSFHE